MVKRILFKITKYFFWEVIVKFLLCYVTALLAYIIASKIEDTQFQTVIINIASSLISLPIVFITYDLYKKILVYKSTKIISENVDKKISNIFLKFIYFSTHFYNEFNSEVDINTNDLDDELNKNIDVIFNDISRVKHHGYFIFSVFDDFDEDIEQLLDSYMVLKYLNSQEVSILHQFIKDYQNLKSCFNWITENDFIKCEKVNNVTLVNSEIAKTVNGSEKYYDIILTQKPGEKITYYVARYRLFDSDVLTFKYKISGNKAKEISSSISKIYKDITKWKKLRNIEKLTIEHGVESCGRLQLDDSLTMNLHMKENVSINSIF